MEHNKSGDGVCMGNDGRGDHHSICIDFSKLSLMDIIVTEDLRWNENVVVLLGLSRGMNVVRGLLSSRGRI